ncbi:MAG: hypothetical protein ACREPE_07395 [Lysobacter sp.]
MGYIGRGIGCNAILLQPDSRWPYPLLSTHHPSAGDMNLDLLIPITLFISLAYTIKAVVDAYTRRRIVESHGSEELVRSLIDGETSRRRHASLHWGSVLVALALGFGLIELIGWNEITPGAIGLLLGVTGVGNFVFYVLERKLK